MRVGPEIQGGQRAVARGKDPTPLYGGHPGAALSRGDKGAQPPYTGDLLSAGTAPLHPKGAQRGALYAQEGAGEDLPRGLRRPRVHAHGGGGGNRLRGDVAYGPTA